MGSLVQERCGAGMSQPGVGSKAGSAVANLGSCCGREREISALLPPSFFQGQQPWEAWTGMAQGRYASEVLFPHVSVWSLLGDGALHHFHKWPDLGVLGEKGKDQST